MRQPGAFRPAYRKITTFCIPWLGALGLAACGGEPAAPAAGVNQAVTLSDADVQQLVVKYGPEVRMHPNDDARIGSIEHFLANAQVCDVPDTFSPQLPYDALLGFTGPGADPQLPNRRAFTLFTQQMDALRAQYGGAGTCQTLTADQLPQTAAAPGRKRVVFPTGAAFEGRSNPAADPPKSYVNVKRRADYTDLQFWYFWPWNGETYMETVVHAAAQTTRVKAWVAPYGMHIGDLEYATVRIDNRTQRPTALYLSQHGGGQWVPIERAARGAAYSDGTFKPVAWAALQGHALFPDLNDPNNRFDETINEAGLVTGRVSTFNFIRDSQNPADRFDSGQSAVVVTGGSAAQKLLGAELRFGPDLDLALWAGPLADFSKSTYLDNLSNNSCDFVSFWSGGCWGNVTKPLQDKIASILRDRIYSVASADGMRMTRAPGRKWYDCAASPTELWCADDQDWSGGTGPTRPSTLWTFDPQNAGGGNLATAPLFRDVDGVNRVTYFNTISIGDIDQDGYGDVCGRYDQGIRCAAGNGKALLRDGNDPRPPLYPFLNVYTGAPGRAWGQNAYAASIRMVDVNGDGTSDVCGRDSAGIVCALGGTQLLTNTPIMIRSAGSDFNDTTGWALANYYDNIRYGDVNGDGRDDVCGKGTYGVSCALSTGVGFQAATLWTTALNDALGWNAASQRIELGDVNGDGKADLGGRGTVGAQTGVFCALSTGASFGPLTRWTDLYGDDQGWGSMPSYYRSFRLADVTGDGKADACARGAAGVFCTQSTGTSFELGRLVGPEFSDANGWGAEQYGASIAFGRLNRRSSGTAEDTTGTTPFTLFSRLNKGDPLYNTYDLCLRGPSGMECRTEIWGATQDEAPSTFVNLARGKATLQSNTYQTGVASLAVDGNRSGYWSGGSVTHTDLPPSHPELPANHSVSFWRVDLGAARYVDSILLWNRQEAPERLRDFDVYISPDGDRWAKRPISGGPGAGAAVKVAVHAAARYVAVALRAAQYLSLAEVEVWGRGEPASADGPLPNLSLFNGQPSWVVLSAADANLLPFRTRDLIPGQVYYLRNLATGQALDVSGGGTADGTPLLSWPFHGAGGQTFVSQMVSDQYLQLKNTRSGKCLTVDANTQALKLMTCEPGCTGAAPLGSPCGLQRLLLGADQSGAYNLNINQTLYLGGQGGSQVYAKLPTGGDTQRWLFILRAP